jgi:hypothetical protein
MLKHDVETKGGLLAKLTRELLQRESFDSLADLTEALKCRCAELRIRPTNDDISDGYRLISSNMPLPGAQPPRRLVERPPEPEVISRRDAERILANLQERVGKVALKRMPAATKRSDRGRRKAARMVAAEIVESVRRCEELEREVE